MRQSVPFAPLFVSVFPASAEREDVKFSEKQKTFQLVWTKKLKKKKDKKTGLEETTTSLRPTTLFASRAFHLYCGAFLRMVSFPWKMMQLFLCEGRQRSHPFLLLSSLFLLCSVLLSPKKGRNAEMPHTFVAVNVFSVLCVFMSAFPFSLIAPLVQPSWSPMRFLKKERNLFPPSCHACRTSVGWFGWFSTAKKKKIKWQLLPQIRTITFHGVVKKKRPEKLPCSTSLSCLFFLTKQKKKRSWEGNVPWTLLNVERRSYLSSVLQMLKADPCILLSHWTDNPPEIRPDKGKKTFKFVWCLTETCLWDCQLHCFVNMRSWDCLLWLWGHHSDLIIGTIVASCRFLAGCSHVFNL